MSRELAEFSDLIEELFDSTEIEGDDFWESLPNLFIESSSFQYHAFKRLKILSWKPGQVQGCA